MHSPPTKSQTMPNKDYLVGTSWLCNVPLKNNKCAYKALHIYLNICITPVQGLRPLILKTWPSTQTHTISFKMSVCLTNVIYYNQMIAKQNIKMQLATLKFSVNTRQTCLATKSANSGWALPRDKVTGRHDIKFYNNTIYNFNFLQVGSLVWWTIQMKIY